MTLLQPTLHSGDARHIADMEGAINPDRGVVWGVGGGYTQRHQRLPNRTEVTLWLMWCHGGIHVDEKTHAVPEPPAQFGITIMRITRDPVGTSALNVIPVIPTHPVSNRTVPVAAAKVGERGFVGFEVTITRSLCVYVVITNLMVVPDAGAPQSWQ